jgi:cyclohexyl-isocyanide hydratase
MQNMDTHTRRQFIQAIMAAGAAAAVASTGASAWAQEKSTKPAPSHEELAAGLKHGSETILILIYPGFTELDAIAPRYALGGMMGAKVRLIAKTNKPLACESGFEITPQLGFDQCPENVDLLVVPGGMTGTLAAIEDAQTMDFVRQVGKRAKMVGSVCTGSLIIGAAGLLKGYEATCHWQALELLPLFGAKANKGRVVFDRDRVTGAGVTAGLDFGLELVRKYRGDFYAKGMQLLAQYDPQPPFAGGGNPATADPAVVALLEQMHKPFTDKAAGVIKKAVTI